MIAKAAPEEDAPAKACCPAHCLSHPALRFTTTSDSDQPLHNAPSLKPFTREHLEKVLKTIGDGTRPPTHLGPRSQGEIGVPQRTSLRK